MKTRLVTSFHVDCRPDGVDYDVITVSTFYADGKIEYHTFGHYKDKQVDEVESLQATSPLNLESIARAHAETGSQILSFE